MRLPRVLLALVAALTFSTPLAAQQIYDHVQKAFYASPAEYPELSTQLHLTRDGAPVAIGDMVSEHGHMEPKCPVKGYTAGELLHCTFRVRSFDLEGRITGIFGELLENIIWNDTGTSTPPDMAHTGMGVKEYRGSFDINPAGNGTGSPQFNAPPHGLFMARVALEMQVSHVGTTDVGGMMGRAEQWVPFFSNIDPTVPMPLIRGNNRVIYESQADVATELDPGIGWRNNRLGTGVTEFYTDIPLAPLTAPWPMTAQFYSYSADPSLPCGSAEYRMDPDFHNGILGTVVDHVDCFPALQGVVRTYVLDPATLSAGPHRFMASWTQLDPDTHQQATTISVVNFVVGTGGPPPLLCEDPAATNFHGLLPCVYQQHVPVITWQATAFFFERQFIDGVAQNVFRFCVGAQCFLLPVTPIP